LSFIEREDVNKKQLLFGANFVLSSLENPREDQMFIYSKSIIRFTEDIKLAAKNILSKEIGLRCLGDRFYDRRETTSYPLKIIIYNHRSMLGYFDAAFYELGFHECLMHVKKEQLYNIIRHELAHYMTFINHGYTAEPHAPEFKAFCQRMNWGESVFRASTELDLVKMDKEESGVLRKIKKLMALSNSSHQNESEQAMIKSQQLLLKHNLESNYIDSQKEEKVFMQRIMKQKKETAKMRAIASILQTFFVSVVYNRGEGVTYLEIIGEELNLEIAEYVAEVLDIEFDRLWDTAKKNAQLKGALAKNSFFLGIAKGYCNKIKALKELCEPEVTSALIVLEKKLLDARDIVYPRLSSKVSYGGHCPQASKLGEKMGRALNINPAIQKKSAQLNLCLPHSNGTK
jgi:hypothetical protein